MSVFTEALFSIGEEKYRDFSASLLPTVNKERIIGVRVPNIRRLAREVKGTPEALEFLAELPHFYLEENSLHALMICELDDYNECVAAVDRFLPYVDNWATCDSMRPLCFKKHKEELITDVMRWISSEQLYTARFGIEMLMLHFLDGDFSPEYLDAVASVRSDEYYLRMMVAWYFATALTKQYRAVLPYIEEHRLDAWVHNKAIQKARESLCIPDVRKQHLGTLRRANPTPCNKKARNTNV